MWACEQYLARPPTPFAGPGDLQMPAYSKPVFSQGASSQAQEGSAHSGQPSAPGTRDSQGGQAAAEPPEASHCSRSPPAVKLDFSRSPEPRVRVLSQAPLEARMACIKAFSRLSTLGSFHTSRLSPIVFMRQLPSLGTLSRSRSGVIQTIRQARLFPGSVTMKSRTSSMSRWRLPKLRLMRLWSNKSC